MKEIIIACCFVFCEFILPNTGLAQNSLYYTESELCNHSWMNKSNNLKDLLLDSLLQKIVTIGELKARIKSKYSFVSHRIGYNHINSKTYVVEYLLILKKDNSHQILLHFCLSKDYYFQPNQEIAGKKKLSKKQFNQIIATLDNSKYLNVEYEVYKIPKFKPVP